MIKFEDFAAAMQARAYMNVDGAMASVAGVYAVGFTGCETLAQRREVGGLTLHAVKFRSEVGPLFVYRLHTGAGEGFTLLQFKMDSDLDVLDNLH